MTLESRKPLTAGRSLAALLAFATLGAIAWFAYWMLPLRQLHPGFMRFFVLFFGGLALPYVVTLALLGWRDGRVGLRFAVGTGLINALWALPLAALLFLFAGFTMGNRDQEQQLLAVIVGALLQIPLFAVAANALRRGGGKPVGGGGWVPAVLVPLLFSIGSLGYFDWQLKEFKAVSAQAAENGRAAQKTIEALKACLSSGRESGSPSTLQACKGAPADLGNAKGYRIEYLPAQPGADGRIPAYMLCATPLSFRASGFETYVADSTGSGGAGATPEASIDQPPSCASVLGVDKAIAWCAFAYAATHAERAYPARLADIAACVAEGRGKASVGPDRLVDGEKIHAYLADPPDAKGRIAHFRVYRLRGSVQWVDDTLKIGGKPSEPDHPGEPLPDLAAPELFMPGCELGQGRDCLLVGNEWQRKARQAPGGERDPTTAPMRSAALVAYARGCELTDSGSCTALAAELEYGNDIERDVVRAAALHEKACAAGDALGCRRGAELYESGRKAHTPTLQNPRPPSPSKPDLPRDVARAISLYEQACERDDRDACFIGGRLLAAGEGLPRDADRALRLFHKACGEGMGMACSRAAQLAPAEEKIYRHRACVFGEIGECR